MDIGKGIQESLSLYLKNFTLLFLAALVVMAISGISFGILAGPMIAGMLVLCLKVLKNEKAEFNEIFAQFNKFVPTFILFLLSIGVWLILMVIGWIPLLGFLINLAVGPAFWIIFFLAIGFITTKEMQPLDAAKQAFACFMTNPLMIWLYVLVLGLIAGVAAFIPSLIFGAIFVLIPFMFFLMPLIWLGLSAVVSPFVFLGMTSAFQELSSKEVAPFKLEKKTLQIVGIVVGALLVLGLCSFFFFTSSIASFNPFGNFGQSRIFNTPFGQVTSDNNGDKITIKTKDGTLSAGAGLPKDFPSDVAIYPEAKPEGHFGGMVTLSTKDAPGQIAAFYEATMAAQGWEISKSEVGDMQILNCTKGERAVSITANPNTEKGLTDILIGIGK